MLMGAIDARLLPIIRHRATTVARTFSRSCRSLGDARSLPATTRQKLPWFDVNGRIDGITNLKFYRHSVAVAREFSTKKPPSDRDPAR